MAITFENVIYDRVIDALHSLIVDEFSIPVYFDEHQGNQSFVLTPGEDTLSERLSGGQNRSYSVELSYQLNSGGNYTKNGFKQVSNIGERMKRLIYNNSAYSPSGTYKWHDGNIETIEYSRDEDNPELLMAIMIFNCNSMESR